MKQHRAKSHGLEQKHSLIGCLHMPKEINIWQGNLLRFLFVLKQKWLNKAALSYLPDELNLNRELVNLPFFIVLNDAGDMSTYLFSFYAIFP